VSEELEEVRVLRVQPGDTIVCRVTSATTHAELSEVGDRLRERFPDNQVLMLSASLELSVTRPDRPAKYTINCMDGEMAKRVADAVTTRDRRADLTR